MMFLSVSRLRFIVVVSQWLVRILLFLAPKQVIVLIHFLSCFQAGLRPICEFMTFNFSMQAIDQVC